VDGAVVDLSSAPASQLATTTADRYRASYLRDREFGRLTLLNRSLVEYTVPVDRVEVVELESVYPESGAAEPALLIALIPKYGEMAFPVLATIWGLFLPRPYLI